MNEEEYKTIMGLNSKDIGNVKLLRAFVNEKLKEKGYNKLRGYKSMKELLAIKIKSMLN
jgi:hypothetical protein